MSSVVRLGHYSYHDELLPVSLPGAMKQPAILFFLVKIKIRKLLIFHC